jgi:hypothetical protein
MRVPASAMLRGSGDPLRPGGLENGKRSDATAPVSSTSDLDLCRIPDSDLPLCDLLVAFN